MSNLTVPQQAVEDWLKALQGALAARNVDAVVDLFAADECFWRDLVAFTWNIATMDGRLAIADMLKSQLDEALPVSFTPTGEAVDTGATVEGWFKFETGSGCGTGHVRLKNGKAWTFLTAMEELKGFEEPAGPRRTPGIIHKAQRGRKTWLELRQEEAATMGFEEQPYCLIIGGGQGGLALGARMKRLGVPTIIIDALEKPGDSWRVRYKSLYLHDPVWIDHLPYVPFPDHWPVYTSKDKMGDWLEVYCKIMELNFWGSTVCRNASYDAQKGEWTVLVERDGKEITLRPKQLVLATGLSGIKNKPDFPGMESFKGLQYHSSDHAGGEGMAGKKVVVVGGNNSAHDICVDMWENEAEVTMIQRSPTTVVKATALFRLAEKGPFSERAAQAGIDTKRADLMVASMPFRMKERIDQANCEIVQEEDAEFYEKLAATGFLLDFGEDHTAIQGKYMRRASGYYIDVGASDLVVAGEVKVRSGVGVASVKPDAVVLTDGSEVPADVIVYATGYGPMDGWAEMLISKDVADKVGRCWGLGSDTVMDPGPWEGELRNMWKPTAQEGLWFHGGNLAQSRFHSLHLALQIKARLEGIDTPVYKPAAFQRPKLVPPKTAKIPVFAQ